MTVWLWAPDSGSARKKSMRPGAEDRTSVREARFWMGIFGATVVFLIHGLVDIDLRYPPNQTLLWLLLGLLAGEQDHAMRITLRSRTARRALVGGCLVVAIGIAFAFVIQPVRADWCEREAQLAEARGDRDRAATLAAQALAIQPLRLATRYYLAGHPGPNAQRESPNSSDRPVFDHRGIGAGLRGRHLQPRPALRGGARPEWALKYLQRAVTLNPYNVDKRVKLALLLRDLGQRAAARQQLEDAQAPQPE